MSHFVHAGIRAVFFDAVGTLIFPEPSAPEVYVAAAQRLGVKLDPAIVRARLWKAFNDEETLDRAAHWVTSEEREYERWQRIVTASLPEVEERDLCFHELFEHFAKPSAWRVNETAAACFDLLRQRGVTLGLASNYDARLLSVLDGHALLAPIRERIVVSAATGFRKPSIAFFAEVMRIAQCEANEILFVGDDLVNDYEGAIASGLNAVLLDPRSQHPHIHRCITSLVNL